LRFILKAFALIEGMFSNGLSPFKEIDIFI